MYAHLPALIVVIPLIGAPTCMLIRYRGWSWGIALLCSWTALALSWMLLQQVMAQGVVSYALGGWVAPLGIEYRIDAANAFVLLIVSAIGSVIMPFARESVRSEFGTSRVYLFYTAYMLCFCGLLGVTITGDAFNLFVFLEISSISSYVLIAMGKDRRALVAAYQYLVMGTIGATFIVIGIGLLYSVTGTLNMVDLAQRIAAQPPSRTLGAAFGFLMVGISLKLALFPLHLWLPNAYTYAPSMVSAFLAATATKVAAYVMLRFLFSIFRIDTIIGIIPIDAMLLVLALIAMFAGSTVAIFQNNLKRMLAYSSLAQIGYIVLGISFTSAAGLTASILHLFNHAVMKGGMFLALGCIVYRIGSVHINDFAGIGRRMPWTTAAFITGGLSLIGVPLTVGFISKWYLVLAAIERGWWPVGLLILASSLIAVVYVWRVAEVAYFKPVPDGAPEVEEAPSTMLIPTWILIGASVYFGLDTGLTVEVAQRAAAGLIGGGG
ncbi:MAG: monovalent cation/H+ antiporter subunit D family protein [Rhodospirillaceae bacterium]|jgi:multicomponent Na+:H+ antiporter subunit D|nr:monovalent cation/H+ antiporter subunit D family protein [Rhodospirillaceae bacterium]